MTEPTSNSVEFPKSSMESWRKLVEKDLKGKPFDVLLSRLEGGITIEPVYSEQDLVGDDESGFPGVAPYVRGTDVATRTSRGWAVCPEHDDPRMDVVRDAIREDLERGADAVWLRLGVDHATRIQTAGDLARVLDAVDLSKIPVWIEAEADVIPMASALIALADSVGVGRDALRGGFGADPLGTLAKIGTLPSGYDSAMRDLCSLARFSDASMPNMRSVLVSSQPYAEAGASLVHELAWSIATAIEYLRRLIEAGLDIDAASKQIAFSFAVGGQFFPEIAKLRAARLLFAKVIAASGGSEASQATFIRARTANATKSKRDPWVNMLRGTTESFAAAVGGADAISTSPYDVVIGPSDPLSRRVARNTQLILRDESNLHRVSDPGGGSYYLESLTRELAKAAWTEVQAIEREGGMSKALRLGRVSHVVEETRAQRERDIGRRKVPVVGVSEFANLGEKPVERAPVILADVEVELGSDFGDSTPEARHGALMDLVRMSQSLTPSIGLVTAAVKAASLGADLYHASAVLRIGQPSVHIAPLGAFRDAMPFEKLRDAMDAYAVEHDGPMRALIVALGTVAEHTARLMWTQNVLAAGGFAVTSEVGLDASSIAAAVKASGAIVVVFAGPDALYTENVPALAGALSGNGAKALALAGKPGDNAALYAACGVTHFLFAGADVRAALESIQDQLGVQS